MTASITIPTPIVSFLSSYPHPSFILSAEALKEALVLRGNLVGVEVDKVKNHYEEKIPYFEGNEVATQTQIEKKLNEVKEVDSNTITPTNLAQSKLIDLSLPSLDSLSTIPSSSTPPTNQILNDESLLGISTFHDLAQLSSSSTNNTNTSGSSTIPNNNESESNHSTPPEESIESKILASAFTPISIEETRKFDPSNISGYKVGALPNSGIKDVSDSKGKGKERDSSRGSINLNSHHFSTSSPLTHSSLLEGGQQADHDASRTAEGAVNSMLEQNQKREDARLKRNSSLKIQEVEEKKENGNSIGIDNSHIQDTESNDKHYGRTLGELLHPIWGNSKWKSLVASKDNQELGLLAFLSRQDASQLLKLFTQVLDGNSEEPICSIKLDIKFPFESIHYLPLAARRSAQPINIHQIGSLESDQSHHSASTTTAGNRSFPLHTTLEVVATLYEGTDYLVITTVLGQVEAFSNGNTSAAHTSIPILSRSTTESSINSNSAEISSTSSRSTPNGSNSDATSPPFTTRPDLPHHNASNESQESTTSNSTLMSKDINSHSNSNYSPLISSRLPTDRLPTPAPQYTGKPSHLTEAPSSPINDPNAFPTGFVLEKKSRKKEKERRKEKKKGKERENMSIVDEESKSADSTTEEREAEDNIPLDFQQILSTPPIDPNLIIPSPPPISSSEISLLPSPLDHLSPAIESIPSFFPESTDPFLLNLLGTPMGRMIRSFPWESTPLGPILSWSSELKVMVTLCLASPFRDAIWIGAENVLIYNDEYAALAGAKHPFILGKSGAVGWSELWDTLGPIADKVMLGETVSYYDNHLPMERNGFVEETYWIWSFIPFRGADGSVIGYSNPCFETTARVVAERRLTTIRDLVQVTSSARNVKDFCQKTLESLAQNPYDVPWAILYTCEAVTPATGKSTRDHLSNTATFRLNLEGTIGVPLGHPSAPKEALVNIDHYSTHSDASSDASNTPSGSTNTTTTAGSSSAIWPFSEALDSRKPVYISDMQNRNQGFEVRGWPNSTSGKSRGLCIPINYEDDTNSTQAPAAILVVGLNPRRPWNELFASFFHLLTRSIGSGMFSVFVSETDAARAAELAQLNRAKSSFFSNVSHELRTPLSLILGPLEDVLSGKNNLGSTDRNRLVTVQKNAGRLLNMVNTLLDFSKLEGGTEQKFKPVLLSRITVDLGSLFRAAIERGGIKFTVDCEPEPSQGAAVFLATDLWEKVVFNLLGNAFKYTITGEITLRVRYTTKEAIVQVSDTGVGIPKNELSKIFERFHRVESNSRTQEGTGIGLALTLEIVKVLGGSLEVESELGKGSTFSVQLPRGSSHLTPSQIEFGPIESVSVPNLAPQSILMIEDAAAWRIDSAEDTRLNSLTPNLPYLPGFDLSASSSSIGTDGDRTSDSAEDQILSERTLRVSVDLLDLKDSVILLVDDNEDLRAYIAGILQKHFVVVQASDGLAALEYALKSPPALVITDMNMPKLNGNGLLEQLRANKLTTLIPVIFLSAEASPEVRVEALNNGADDFLIKPFQSRELLARVNVHLQLHKFRIQLEKQVISQTRALKESQKKFKALANRYSTLSVLSPVGIFLIDAAGNLTYANPRFYEISGHPLDKPLSEWRDNVLPEDLAKTHAFFIDGISAGKDADYMEFRFRSGSWVQFELRAFQESVDSGEEGRGFVGAITDISRPKKIEALHIQTINQRATDAEENRKHMELFIDMASHELRNPLSGVYQNASVVGSSLERITEVFDEIRLDGVIPDSEVLEDIRGELEENSEAIENIILCASHQGRIADDILNISKLNMGLLSVNPTPFNLVSKMTEVLRMFDVECQQKQIDLSLDQGPSIEQLKAGWIVADPSRLAQILINFLTNSVKFTSDGTERKIVIHVDAYQNEPPRSNRSMRVAEPSSLEISEGRVWIVVGVEDTGKGLNREELAKLFARFSQANPKSDQYGGSGLGLYVSRALVELHHGFIEVESSPGQGSTFRFAIPADISSQLEANSSQSVYSNRPTLPIRSNKRINNNTSLNSVASQQATTSDSIESNSNSISTLSKEKQVNVPLHVLVVEDNLINQKVMQRQLRMEKFLVTVANNGQEALDIILAEQKTGFSTPSIDIVLMDIEMPIMDGLTAIKKLRELERTAKVTRRYNVIAVTGNARQGQIDECINSGFDDVAIKPYKMAELLVQIHKIIDTDYDATP